MKGRRQTQTTVGKAALLASLCVLPITLLPASAETGTPFAVSGDLVGKTKKNGKTEAAENLSGIACAEATGFPRNCLLVDDEAQFAQFVTVNTDSLIAGKKVPLTDSTFDDKPLEFDGEGVAFECD